MLRCHRTALNTGPFEVINTKMKRNIEWKDRALNSISQPCRVKTGLLWPPSPAAVNRVMLCLWSQWSHYKHGSCPYSYFMFRRSILKIAVTESWLLVFVGTVLVSRRACKEKISEDDQICVRFLLFLIKGQMVSCRTWCSTPPCFYWRLCFERYLINTHFT